MEKRLRVLLLGLILISIVYSVDTSVLMYFYEQPSYSVKLLWNCIFALILALWIKHDPNAGAFDKPFDIAFYAMVGWPLVLPYYLFMSRGFVRGGLISLGFLLIFSWPYIMAAAVYYFS